MQIQLLGISLVGRAPDFDSGWTGSIPVSPAKK